MAIRIKKATDKSEMNLTVRAYIEKLEDDEVTFNIDIQRGYVWKDIERRSALIQSLIINDIIPPFIFNKVDGVYEGMDSKQRSLTILKFMKNEFALKGVQPIEIVNEDGEWEEIDINDLKYSELPDYIQNAIKEYNLSIWFLCDADQEQVARNFCNLNNGKAINAPTLNRIKAKSKNEIRELSKHEVFKEALTKTALDGHVDEDLVVKAHAMIYAPEPSMNTKWVRPYMKSVLITEDQVKVLNNVFDRIQEIHRLIEDKKIQKRIYTRTHMMSIVPVIEKSIDDDRSIQDMVMWFTNFFSGSRSASISSTYNSAAGGSGTGRKEAVKKRVDELLNNYNEYFKD